MGRGAVVLETIEDQINIMTYDLAIIGGGPAGVGAGVYAARKKIRTVFITETFVSQSTVSENIQNWIGTVSIKGEDLTNLLEKHLRAYANGTVDIQTKETALEIKKKGELFLVKTNKAEYTAKTVLIATGSMRKKLTVKGAEQFENKGITYCASCDAPLFGDADVAVIGGGNSAFESAAQLLAYAKSVTILQRSDFKADPTTIERVLSDKRVTAIPQADLLEIKGDQFVKSIVYKNKKSGETKEISVTGVFVEIGANPSTGFIKDRLVETNAAGEIIADPKTQRTSQTGIWAAGDCTDGLYKQNNIAVGDAIKALENIYNYLKA